MRKLSISTKNRFDLQKYENQSIATIASNYANTEKELDRLYELGIQKLEEYKNKLTTKDFDRFGFWCIKQEIIKGTRTPNTRLCNRAVNVQFCRFIARSGFVVVRQFCSRIPPHRIASVVSIQWKKTQQQHETVTKTDKLK